MEKKEFEKYANAEVFKDRISGLAKGMITSPLRVEFSLKEGSYYASDWKLLTIGFGPFMKLCETRADMFIFMHALVTHECEHVLSTNPNFWKKSINALKDKYQKALGLSEAGARKMAHSHINILEDGRIERIASLRYVNIAAKFQYLRMAMALEEEFAHDTLNQIMSGFFAYATRADDPLNIEYFNKEAIPYIEALKPICDKFVNTKELDVMSEALDELSDLMIEIILKFRDESNQGSQGAGESSDSSPGDNSQNSAGQQVTGEGLSGDNSQNSTGQQDTGEDAQSGKATNGSSGQPSSGSLSLQDAITAISSALLDAMSEGRMKSEGENQKNNGKKSGAQANEDTGDEGQDGDETTDDKKLSDEDIETLRKAAEIVMNNLDDEIKKEIDAQAQIKEARERGTMTITEIKNAGVTRGVRFRRPEMVDSRYEFKDPNLVMYKREFERLLKARNKKPLKQQRSGHLNTKQLTRLSTNRTDIFYKKAIPHAMDCAIAIAIDRSGSMSSRTRGGSRLDDAMRAAALLEAIFQNYTPLKIFTFTTSSTIEHDILKDFDVNNKYSLCNYKMSPGGGNCDSFAIKCGVTELAKRSEENKILFVLSDGLPSSAYSQDTILKEFSDCLKQADKEKVKVISIAIDGKEADYRKYYGDKRIICCPPEKIGDEVLLYIRRNISKL